MTKRLFIPVALTLLTACGVSSMSQDATLAAQAKKPSEEIPLQNFTRACTMQVAVMLVDSVTQDYAFVTPGATCTNEFLGGEALTLVDPIKSSSITAAADRRMVDIIVTSKTNRQYLTRMDADLNVLQFFVRVK